MDRVYGIVLGPWWTGLAGDEAHAMQARHMGGEWALAAEMAVAWCTWHHEAQQRQ